MNILAIRPIDFAGAWAVTMLILYNPVVSLAVEAKTSVNEIVSARPVPTAIVQKISHEKVRLFPGTVKSQKSVNLAFSVDGLLKTLNGKEGQRFNKGDVIAVIDQRDFTNSLAVARANYLNLKTELSRADSLREQKVISQAKYDVIKKNFDITAAELRISEKALSDTTIYAPFDGVISKRYVENREHVKKHASIISLKDIRDLEVEIKVPEILMAYSGVKPFLRIEVTFDAEGKENWHPADIREYKVQADPVTRTYDVAVGFICPDDIEILPGMTATVKVVFKEQVSLSGQSVNISLVPVESVFSESDGSSYVWRIPEKSGKPQKVKVSVGALRNNTVEILDGLHPGMQVATAGVHKLHKDMVVRPMRRGAEGLDG